MSELLRGDEAFFSSFPSAGHSEKPDYGEYEYYDEDDCSWIVLGF